MRCIVIPRWINGPDKDEVMRKTVTKLIIGSAGLWLALPAAAQLEIDPDHFDEPGMIALQPCPEHSNGSMRTSPPYKQVQVHRVEGSKAKKSSVNTQRELPTAAAVQYHSVSRGSRVARRPADRKATEQSRLGPSRRPYEGVPP